MVHICNSLYWKYCGGNNHCYHFLNKKLFIYQRISWNFVSSCCNFSVLYVWIFFFQMQSLMWNFVSLALFGTWSWNAFWKIYILFVYRSMNSEEEFWIALAVCDTDVYLYIYMCNNNCIIQILLFIIEWFDCRNIFVTWYINY